MNPLKKAKRNAKRSVANATGVPTTKSGRARKVERIEEGQAILWIVVVVAVIWLVAK